MLAEEKIYFPWRTSSLNSFFTGYKEFIQEYTIPDFIKYIENHPKCNEIDYSDDSIYCKNAEESPTLMESEF